MTLLCSRCLTRKLTKPRNAVTIFWGDALCRQCLDRRTVDRQRRLEMQERSTPRLGAGDRGLHSYHLLPPSPPGGESGVSASENGR